VTRVKIENHVKDVTAFVQYVVRAEMVRATRWFCEGGRVVLIRCWWDIRSGDFDVDGVYSNATCCYDDNEDSNMQMVPFCHTTTLD